MADIFRLQLLLATFAGWVNRHPAQIILHPVEENRLTFRFETEGELQESHA